MKIAWHIIKKHVIAIIMFLLYTLLWIRILVISDKLKHVLDSGLLYVFMLFVGAILILVHLAVAIIYRQPKFHLLMIIITVIQMIILCYL